MTLADNIRKLGFRRWHERQLIEAHASLVTAFLSVIAIAVCLDQFHWRESGAKPLIMLVLMAAGFGLCLKTVTLYFKVLFRAEHYAAQAVCSACDTYGAIEIVRASLHDDGEQLQVRCRKCRHDWTVYAQQEQPSSSTRL